MVADRGPDRQLPAVYYPKACTALLAKIIYGHIDTFDVQTWEHPSIVGEYVRRVQNVIWHRRFISTKRRRLMGIAPMNSREKDLVCVLFGCSVPVILRPSKVLDAYPMGPFKFIGEAFIYGQMDAELIIQLQSDNTLKEAQRTFVII